MNGIEMIGRILNRQPDSVSSRATSWKGIDRETLSHIRWRSIANGVLNVSIDFTKGIVKVTK